MIFDLLLGSLILFPVFVVENNVFWTPRRKTMQNHLEQIKKSVLEPKRAKFNQKSEHGHEDVICADRMGPI